MQANDEEFYCDFCKAFGVVDPFYNSPTPRPYGWVVDLDGPHACSHDCWEVLGLKREDHICTHDCPWDVFSGPHFPPQATQKPYTFGRGRVRDGYVYFIQVDVDGPIKIGFAADIRDRMSNLQTSSPYDLKLLAWFEGTVADERAMHAKFSQHRLRGEWFRPADDLCRAIEEFRIALL